MFSLFLFVPSKSVAVYQFVAAVPHADAQFWFSGDVSVHLPQVAFSLRYMQIGHA